MLVRVLLLPWWLWLLPHPHRQAQVEVLWSQRGSNLRPRCVPSPLVVTLCTVLAQVRCYLQMQLWLRFLDLLALRGGKIGSAAFLRPLQFPARLHESVETSTR